MYPFLKKKRSPLIEVAASNTSSRLHCSSLGFGRGSSGSSVGSSGSGPGSGPGGGLGFGAVVGTGVRLPEGWVRVRVLLKQSTFEKIRVKSTFRNM